ncbi:NAD(P)/FAD-dependent oxidoreductase [Georgenia subflava]|uniref:NAD(P)/FAD-dependent oxidoreductase n=1 Tax=Georgenia subflava TaxID=1622177 RepID=A0A6N7EG90_9MICO|nr:FAD-dependent oxidoreductase [Georgenia subflava]MPV36193.1 NAD(P)/FAD-dependent oxidoreductase [Georgenia subflava]
MSQPRGIVIVGGGLAGARAAQTLREEGYEDRIVIVGEESERPYERPPLSKEYLAGTAEREAGFVHPEGWYSEHDVELILGRRVTELDLPAHEVALATGDRLAFDTVLLATGASSRRLRGPGSGEGLAGVHYLRTRAESDALRTALADGGRRVVIVGAGWIGLEIAAAARTYGNDVTVLGRETVPLSLALGDELGEHFGALHRAHGVDLRMSTSVAEIRGTEGAVTGVVLEDGETVPADVVVVGIGAVPNDELARAAGLDVDGGVIVDEHLRSSHPDVYAVGDVAKAFHPVLGRHLRVEHWANALNAAPIAARAMLGQDVVDDLVPYFYTDQYDLGMEYSGYFDLARDAEVVYRGDPAGGEFIAFWVAEEKVVAGMNVNVWDVSPAIEKLVRTARPVDRARLRDLAVPLEQLTAQPAT